MKLKIEMITCELYKSEIERLVQLDKLSDIVKGWVKEDQNLVVISGSDDLTGEKQAYLLFERKGEEVASAYYDKNTILADHPLAQELVPPPLLKNEYNLYLSEEESIEDKRYYKRVEKLLKCTWSEDLCASVISLDAAINYALGLAISERGETNFCIVSDGFIEEIENPILYKNHFLWSTACRSNADGTASLVDSFYVDLRLH